MRTVHEYLNRYPNRRFVIVGKGKTRFQFESLSSVRDPIIFLNDAVQFESAVRRTTAAPETFFFAHDEAQKTWIEQGLRSTVVIARAGAVDSGQGHPMLCLEGSDIAISDRSRLVTYEWGGWYGKDHLRLCTRRETAETGRLYLNSGTIHTAIHFAWLCGAKQIVFIGCDGLGRGYDERIEVKSGRAPLGVFNQIRRVQDWECEQLGLETEYVNEPQLEKRIPRLAHFAWIGRLPSWAERNIRDFAALHPSWEIRLWDKVPSDMPRDLRMAAIDSSFLCQRTDILRYWALHSFGGIYLDVDMLPRRSLEPLRRYEAFAAVQHDGRINCAAMGTVPRSEAFTWILKAVRALAKTCPEHRAAYGPNLLTELFRNGNHHYDNIPLAAKDQAAGLSVLPEHYFYLLIDQKEAHPFWRASEQQRQEIIESHKQRITDPSAPYAVHLWGVDGSSKRRPFGRADALVARLRDSFDGRPIRGAEIGVLAGRLSEHVLREMPNVHLLMVDHWQTVPSESRYAQSGDLAAQRTAEHIEEDYRFACRRTQFARSRRQLIRQESAQAAADVPDGSLDFVFIDADHTEEGVRLDLEAWYPKVRPGGLVCGHDIDNPGACREPPGRTAGVTFENPLWGVRLAVEKFIAARCPDAELELGGETTWYWIKPGTRQK